MDPLLNARFPTLGQITDTVGQEVLSQARLISLPPGAIIFSPGDCCESYLLVVEGSVKVLGRSAGGREIILYRIQNTGSCVLTTSCLLSKDDYAAEGVTETAVKAFAIPRSAFKQGLEHSAGFRDFIFEAYGERLSALITLIQEVAFERIDLRLARYLCSQGEKRVELHCTHQELATELGSAREVVSRQLKAFEKQGWIRLGRGIIQLDDLESLQSLCEES